MEAPECWRAWVWEEFENAEKKFINYYFAYVIHFFLAYLIMLSKIKHKKLHETFFPILLSHSRTLPPHLHPAAEAAVAPAVHVHIRTLADDVFFFFWLILFSCCCWWYNKLMVIITYGILMW